MAATGTIVVGADGSPSARAAIEYALQDAERHGREVRIVADAQIPQYWADSSTMPAMPTPEEIAWGMRAAARLQLQEVRRARPELAVVPVTVEATTGAPGPVLVDVARGADLLVLGHRGRGAVRSALLGSVGLHCVLHARCPVTMCRPNGLGLRVERACPVGCAVRRSVENTRRAAGGGEEAMGRAALAATTGSAPGVRDSLQQSG